MSECVIIPTTHAFARLEERGISPEEVRDAIIRGSKRQNPDGTISARCGSCKAIFKKRPCKWLIITVFIPTSGVSQ